MGYRSVFNSRAASWRKVCSSVSRRSSRRPDRGSTERWLPVKPCSERAAVAAVSGVTATEITIAISLINAFGAAGNSTFGIPSADEQQQDYDQVIAATNAHGGVACRKLVAKYYQVNSADQSDQQQRCLDIIESRAF